MIFSTNQIPELQAFSLKDRRAIMALAMNKLTVPEKLILNLIKLCLIIPPFMYLSAKDFSGFFMVTLAVMGAYLLIMRPLSMRFARKYVGKAITLFESES